MRFLSSVGSGADGYSIRLTLNRDITSKWCTFLLVVRGSNRLGAVPFCCTARYMSGMAFFWGVMIPIGDRHGKISVCVLSSPSLSLLRGRLLRVLSYGAEACYQSLRLRRRSRRLSRSRGCGSPIPRQQSGDTRETGTSIPIWRQHVHNRSEEQHTIRTILDRLGCT